jgi:uncharacterized protein YggE
MRNAHLGLLLIGAACARSAPNPAYDDRNRISVTGEAMVNVAPDRIIVTFGIDTRDSSLLVAKRENDVIARAALAAVKRLGVPDKDIQTDQVSITQRYRTGPQGDRDLDGYTVRNMFAVTLDDPKKVDALITRTLDAGANYLIGVDFQTTALKQHREQARELAIKAAREKAEKLAGPLGATVGAPMYINEDQRYGSYSYYSSWSSGGWGSNARNDFVGQSQNAVQASGGETTDEIALGKVGVRAAVSVTFELNR